MGLIALVATIVIIAIGVAIAELRDNGPSQSALPDRSHYKTRTLQIDLSENATRFTEPVREDGTIDYIAALNQSLSQGVTKDNNAFRDIIQVINPDRWWQDEYDRLLVALEIDTSASTGQVSFLSWESYYELKIDRYADDDEEAKALLEALLEDPFDHPDAHHLQAWVGMNEQGLDAIGSALNKPKYWCPLLHDEVGDNQLLIASYGLHHKALRDIAKCFRARLIYETKHGNQEDAADAVNCILRLAALQSQAPTLIDGLIAISIEAEAIFAVRQALSHRLLDRVVLAKIAARFTPTDGRKSIVWHIDVYERCQSLDGMMQIAAGRASFTELTSGDVQQRPFDLLFLDERFDINTALQIINTRFNDLIALMRSDAYTVFSKRCDAFEESLTAQQETSEHVLFLERGTEKVLNNGLGHKAHTHALTKYYIGIMMPALSAAYRTELRLTANYRNTRVAVAVERFRLDHGKLPDSLGDLVPNYLHAIPLDPFNDQPLRYGRTDNGFVAYSVGTNLIDDQGLEDHAKGDTAIVIDWTKP